MIEFIVDDFEIDGDFLHLMGMVNVGTIEIGCVFSSISNAEAAQSPPKQVGEIALIVRNIVAYGHSLSELPQGMSGELVVAGRGFETVRKRALLQSHDEKAP